VAEEEEKKEESRGYVFEDPKDNLRAELITEFIVSCGLPVRIFHKEYSVAEKGVTGKKAFTRVFIKRLIGLIDSKIINKRVIERKSKENRYFEIRNELAGDKQFHDYYVGLSKGGGKGKNDDKTLGGFDGDTANMVAYYIVAWAHEQKQIDEVDSRIAYWKRIRQEAAIAKQTSKKGLFSRDVSSAEDRLDKLDTMKNKIVERLSKIAKEGRKIVREQHSMNMDWTEIDEEEKKRYRELESEKELLTEKEYGDRLAGLSDFFSKVKSGKKKGMDRDWRKYVEKGGYTTDSRKVRKEKYEEIYGTRRRAGADLLGEDRGDRSEREARRAEFEKKKRALKDGKKDKSISKEEYKRRMAELRRDYKPSERSRASGYAKAIESRLGPKITKGIWLAALTSIGVILSNMTGVVQFTLAFIAWGFMYILPHPDDYEVPEELTKSLEKDPLRWSTVFSSKYKYLSHQHAWAGYFRSMLKMTTYGFFIWGLWSISNLAFVNIALVIVSFMAYYSLKIDYDPHKPHELMESLLRFGVLGAFVIPVMIFWTIFDSVLLAGIAFAFFAIPPIPNDRDKSELFVMYDFYDKILFSVIMLAVLAGFFLGWGGFGAGAGEGLGSTLSTVFVYFWAICGVSGFFSPAMARPGIGFMMLGMATFVYASGPGQQEFFSALFGPWWPTIQNTISSIFTPMGEAFSGIGNTFSQGWLLMTNPVGYATQLMNGSHAQNPQGVTGPHGIEFNSFTVSQIYPNQPFMANVILRNNGAFEAESVRLYMSIGGGDAPKKTMTFLSKETQVPWADTMEISSMGLISCVKEGTTGLPEGYYVDGNCLYIDDVGKVSEYFARDEPSMEKQFVTQYSFEGNISCDVVNAYDLRNKAIPLRARVVYDYQVDSNVDVEFISKDEWDRLARDNMLDYELRFIQSEYSSAPVKLPLGTAGLKNPILATQAFHISILLDTDMGKNSIIRKTDSIELVYPGDWKLAATKCTADPVNPNPPVKDGVKKLVFDYSKDEAAGAKTIVCHFEAVGDKIGEAPTKTYKVTAHANYTFEMWKDLSTRIAFGGFCCSDKDCPTGYECDDEKRGDKEPTYSCVTEGSYSSVITKAEAINIKSDSADIHIEAGKLFEGFEIKYWKITETEAAAEAEGDTTTFVRFTTWRLRDLEPDTDYKYRVTVWFDKSKDLSDTSGIGEFTTLEGEPIPEPGEGEQIPEPGDGEPIPEP
jgi:hypothetical protein